MQFLRWLKSSPLNVRELLRASEVDRLLGDLDPDRAIDISELIAQARGAAPTATELHPDRPRDSSASRIATAGWSRGWRVAAALAVMALIVVGTISVDRSLRERWIVTEAGEWRALRLADDTRVTMGPRTRLRLSMGGSARNAYLSGGEALFEVARDEQRPFVVYADETVTRVLGTAFAVDDHGGAVRVTVVDGAVAVARPGTASVDLQAGQRLVAARARQFMVGVVDPTIELAWTRGELVFTGATVSEAAREFNRRNRLQLDVADSTLARQRVFGVFKADDPRSFVRVVARSTSARGSVREVESGRLHLTRGEETQSRSMR